MPRDMKVELGKRYSLSAKTSLETNLALKAAAERNGRSVAAEVEMRLEASLRADDLRQIIREEVRAAMNADRDEKSAVLHALMSDMPDDEVLARFPHLAA